MKVEVKERKVDGYKYPCLMMYETYNLFVLFVSDGCGTCLIDESGTNKIGSYSNYWNMELFKPFDGEITLKND